MSEPNEINGADRRPTRSSGLTLVGLLSGVVLAAVVLGQLTAPDPAARPKPAIAPEPATSIGVESAERCPLPLGALTLGDHLKVRGSAIDVWDCNALTQGPWSLVIRASGVPATGGVTGQFGVRSAVVIFPFPVNLGFRWPQDPPPPEGFGPSSTPVTKPEGGRWFADTQSLLWPLGGSQALIVGDVGRAQLADLAMGITVGRGAPRFSPLNGFAAEATTTFRPPVIHHVRYGTADLGQEGTLGSGQIWTGVVTGAFLQSKAFVGHAKPAGLVRGEPAIYSRSLYPEWISFGPDSGYLAWESAPGEVTFIGFSGTADEAAAIETLRSLANKGTVLTPAQWLNRDRAQTGS